MHTSDELRMLWEFLEGKHILYERMWEKNGLRAVAFSKNAEEFAKTYKRNAGMEGVRRVAVMQDIGEVLASLTSADVRGHHLTCAAEQGVGDNTAFCIHYRDEGIKCAVAIPGVNYSYTAEAWERLKPRDNEWD